MATKRHYPVKQKPRAKRVKTRAFNPQHRAPTSQETVDNLAPALSATYRTTNDAQFQQTLVSFETTNNVHPPPVPTLTMPKLYDFNPHGRWDDHEKDVFLNAGIAVTSKPADGTMKKEDVYRSIAVYMNSSRTWRALENKLNQLTSAANKPTANDPNKGYRYAEFCKLKKKIDGYRVHTNDQSRQDTVNRYTQVILHKEKNRVQRKREQDKERKNMEDNFSKLCKIMITEHGTKKKAPDPKPVQKPTSSDILMEIRNVIDEVESSNKLKVDSKEWSKLRRFTVHQKEDCIIEYTRIKSRYTEPSDVIAEMIKFCNLVMQ